MMLLTRPHIALAAALAAAALSRPVAAQEGDVAGTYTVSFSEVADNCEEEALDLERSELEIDRRDEGRIVARIPELPAMRGTQRRGGQFRAEVRADESAIDGAGARYSVAGRVRSGQVQLVFIAEYYRGDRPLCTQSWSGTGS